MRYIQENKAIRAKVRDREAGGFPVTVNFSVTAETEVFVEDLDGLEALRIRHGLAEREVVYSGKSWRQLHD